MDCIEISRLRLDRAIEHIHEFDAEARDFFKGSPFRIEAQFYSEDGQDCVSYHFRVSQEIPQRLGTIAGECCCAPIKIWTGIIGQEGSWKQF